MHGNIQWQIITGQEFPFESGQNVLQLYRHFHIRHNQGQAEGGMQNFDKEGAIIGL
jgi:hypothetical protein